MATRPHRSLSQRIDDLNVGLWGMVAFGLGYELEALRAGAPTVTDGVKAIAADPRGALLLWALAGAAVFHFLLDDSDRGGGNGETAGSAAAGLFRMREHVRIRLDRG